MCETLRNMVTDLIEFSNPEPTHTLPVRKVRKMRSRVNRYLEELKDNPPMLDTPLPTFSTANLTPPSAPPFRFTIIHSVSSEYLPDSWHNTFTTCSRLCQNPLQVEYLLVVDYQDRTNLGVFSTFFRKGSTRILKGVFGSFRLILNKHDQTPQDRWHAGARQAHPQSLKIAVSNVQSVEDTIIQQGWDMLILAGLADMDMKYEWTLKDYPEDGRFVKIGHLDRHMFIQETL